MVDGLHPGMRLLEVGCGTGNYLRAIAEDTGSEVWGIEPSREMLDRATVTAPSATLRQVHAEKLGVADASFDRVISVDVIHHVSDRTAYFREVARVLRPGGTVCTVTDSEDDIPRRRPLSSHFPETIPIELRRYPTVCALGAEMRAAGLSPTVVQHAQRTYAVTSAAPYQDRAYSALHYLPQPVYERRLAELEAELAASPIDGLALYTLLWATTVGRARPGRPSPA